MTARTKSILIIVTTLIIGIAIGALGAGTVFNQRVETLQALREDDGFMFFIERVIEPTDEAQRQEIRVVLRKAAQKRMGLRRSMIEEQRELFSEMRTELDQILTDAQKEKLRTWVEEEMKRGGPPGGPPPVFRRGRPGELRPDSIRLPRRFRPRQQVSPDSGQVD